MEDIRRKAYGPLEGLALIFDMDGVIVDSNPIHREAWEIYNRRFGIPMTEEMHRRMYGRRNDEIVRDFFGPDLSDTETADHGAAKEALYREMMAPRLEASLVRGIREFLSGLSHVPKAVASNAEPANLEFVLDRSGLGRFFPVVIDGHQVDRPKPHPDIYLRAAEALGIAPANCIVFEDSYSGLAAAESAGMRRVAVRTTHDSFPGVDLVIEHFLETGLKQWLREQRPV